MESVRDIYWGYVWDKISHITWRGGAILLLIRLWQCLGSFPSHSPHLSGEIISYTTTALEIIVTVLWLLMMTWLIMLWLGRVPPPGAWSCYLLSWWMSRSRPDCCHHTFTDRHSPQSISASCWQDSEIYRVNTLRFNIGVLYCIILCTL